MSIVICKLPKAGLGNQLFPLMKAYVFARLNNLPVIVVGYHQLKIGVYLRNEKTKRNYNNYFIFQKGLIGESLDKLKAKKWADGKREPALNKEATLEKSYVFGDIPHWSDYFAQLRDHRQMVINEFWQLLSNPIKQLVDREATPCIGVHIRMGDFRKLQAGEDFKKAGAVRTPEFYFVEVINTIRSISGKDLPVTVVTDGYRHEFEQLFSLKNVTLLEGNPDIVDMLVLSKSKVIVTSAASTFSYWAGFLSDVPVIIHPDHLHPNFNLRNDHRLFEGTLDTANGDLVRYITDLV